MRRVDAVLAAVLAVAAVATALGVATYDDARLGLFDVEWATRATRVGPVDATVTGAGSVELALPADVANLTALEVLARVAAPSVRVQPVAVRAELLDPAGNVTATAEGTIAPGGPATAELPLRVDVAPLPASTQVRAASPAAARAQADGSAWDAGRGTWTLVVRVDGTAVGPAGEAYAVTAEATLAHAAAEVRPVAPEARPR